MALKKDLPQISKMNMRDIYFRIITEGINEIPAFLIFENQPFDAMRFCMQNGNDVLYFNNSDNIVDRIIDEIKKPNIDKEDAPGFMIHSLDNAEVGLMYAVAIILADALSIPCPQVEFRDNLDMHGVFIADINLVNLHTAPELHDSLLLVRVMAHEFRHVWQHIYHPEYQDMYVDSSKNVEGYFNCVSENDAEAFALKLMLDVFEIDELVENEEYVGGNKELKEHIASLRDKIQIDEESIWRLRMLFGIE